METERPADNEQAAIELAMDIILHAIIEHEAVGRPHPIRLATIELGSGQDVVSVVIDQVGIACRNELQALVGLLFNKLERPDRVAAVIDSIACFDPSQTKARRVLLEVAWEQPARNEDGWDGELAPLNLNSAEAT